MMPKDYIKVTGIAADLDGKIVDIIGFGVLRTAVERDEHEIAWVTLSPGDLPGLEKTCHIGFYLGETEEEISQKMQSIAQTVTKGGSEHQHFLKRHTRPSDN
jgi:hypothetical protein